MLIEDNLKVKNLEELTSKLINLVYLQSREIDILQFKMLLKVEHKYQKAQELLDISKNIEPEIKDKLRKEIDACRESNGLLQETQKEKED